MHQSYTNHIEKINYCTYQTYVTYCKFKHSLYCKVSAFDINGPRRSFILGANGTSKMKANEPSAALWGPSSPSFWIKWRAASMASSSISFPWLYHTAPWDPARTALIAVMELTLIRFHIVNEFQTMLSSCILWNILTLISSLKAGVAPDQWCKVTF